MHNLDVRTESMGHGVGQISRQRAEIRRDQPPYRNRAVAIILMACASWGVVFALYYIVRLYL